MYIAFDPSNYYSNTTAKLFPVERCLIYRKRFFVSFSCVAINNIDFGERETVTLPRPLVSAHVAVSIPFA